MTPFSRLYGRATQLRRAWYERHPHWTRRLARPVISVGNLVVGGSGKTPVVAALARQLRDRGERPAILSRGYGRRRGADGVVLVSDGRQPLVPASASGDEPQMLARALPDVIVAVSADRYLAGCLAERRFACKVHLLDDGFQHVQLARDVDLLVMAPQDLDERVIPSGRLREPLEAARLADAMLVVGSDEDGRAVAHAAGVETFFRVATHYGAPRLIAPFSAALPAVSGKRAVAVAGIARPERFCAALRAEGWEVVRELLFRDHHWFSARDLRRIEQAAAEARADVIMTTEKDAARLVPQDGGDEPRRPPFAYLPLDVAVEPAEAFASWLDVRLAAARARRAVEAA